MIIENKVVNNNAFIVLMAFLMSLAAMAIDTMLPALDNISVSFNLANANEAQLVISLLFFGMAFGQMFYGPYSDAVGRKRPLYLGLIIFIIGSAISLFSQSFTLMLIGRFLQGFGAASSRVVSMAIIRDKFVGNEMGQIMSLIMVMFVLVPALAPSLGQVILYFAHWRIIFAMFIVLGFIALALLFFRQEETLAKEKRIPFTFNDLYAGAKETLSNTITLRYMLASGCIFGAFVGYLTSSQQVLQYQFKLGSSFSYYFGILALCIGVSSYINSKFIMKHGLRKLSLFSLSALFIISSVFLIFIYFTEVVSLTSFLTYMGISFLFMGVLFGNLSTLALEPLGHIAGIANTVISSIQTLISVVIGGYIGHLYNGTIIPLVIGFCIMSLIALLSIWSQASET